MDVWTKRRNARVTQPSSSLALCHFTICFLSHFQGRNYVFSISTLNDYLHKLVLRFPLHIKVFGVVTTNPKGYATVFFIQVDRNEMLPLNPEGSKQSRLKCHALAEVSAPRRRWRHWYASQDNCGKVPPCTEAGCLLPPLPTRAGLGR